jgi:hypothetical protein
MEIDAFSWAALSSTLFGSAIAWHRMRRAENWRDRKVYAGVGWGIVCAFFPLVAFLYLFVEFLPLKATRPNPANSGYGVRGVAVWVGVACTSFGAWMDGRIDSPWFLVGVAGVLSLLYVVTSALVTKGSRRQSAREVA